jgi:hypothetical protein
MPRQNFISKEFFVNVEESNARTALLSLMHCSESIKFIKENELTQSFRFLYQPRESKKNYQIDISILPLDNAFTHVSLHLSYPNGQAIQANAHIKATLLLFEHLIYASVKGEANKVMEENQTQVAASKKLFPLFQLNLGNLFFNKRKDILRA